MRRFIAAGTPPLGEADHQPVVVDRVPTAVHEPGRSQRQGKAVAPSSSDHHANVLSNASVRSYEGMLPRLAALRVSISWLDRRARSSAVERALLPKLGSGPGGIYDRLCNGVLGKSRGGLHPGV